MQGQEDFFAATNTQKHNDTATIILCHFLSFVGFIVYAAIQ